MLDQPAKAVVPLACPFAVLVDTREQRPYAFEGLTADARQRRRPLLVTTRRATLHAGDYSVEGLQPLVAVERKSKADLFSTLGQPRGRFVRELERLAELTFAAVVVEAEWSEIYATPPARSHLPPKIILRSVLAWQQRFPRVHWLFCPGRGFAERVTFRILERFWKEEQKRRAVDVQSPAKGVLSNRHQCEPAAGP